jgi:predicted ester cyclase
VIEENKALIRQYLAALSGKDKPESIVNIYVSDEKLKQHIKLFESAFPRYKLIIEDMIAEGDKVAVRATFWGIHRGEFMGIQPTSKEVTISGMLIYRIANGKIVEYWMNFDNLRLMEQLGVVLKSQ